MTDKQIIKGLECCNREDNAVCDGCPYNEYNRVDAHYPYSCQRYLMMDALALVKRQKKQLLEQMLTVDEHCDKCIAEIRAEAIREFAERFRVGFDANYLGEEAEAIYNWFEKIAREMTEEQE